MAPPPTVDMYVNKKNLFIVEGSSTYYAPMSACHSHLTYCPMKAVDPYGLYNGQMYRIETIYSETDEYIYAEMLSFADGWSGTVIDMDTVELSGITYKRQIPSIYLDITGQWQDGWLRPSIMNEGSEEFDDFVNEMAELGSWEAGAVIIDAIPIYKLIEVINSEPNSSPSHDYVLEDEIEDFYVYKDLIDKYEFNLPDDSDELIFIYTTEVNNLQPPYDNNKLGILINPLYYVGLKQEQDIPDTPPSEPIVVLPKLSTLEINGKDFNFKDKRGYTKTRFDYFLQQIKTEYENLPKTVVNVNLTPGSTSYGWQTATVTNPQPKYKMYESTNNGKGSTYSVMKVTFSGYKEFTFYINSYAESSYDYTIVSKLDASSYPTSTSGAYANTSGKQYNPTTFNTTNWQTVTFSNLDKNEHYFYVVFRKDGSVDSFNDKGYILIEG